MKRIRSFIASLLFSVSSRINPVPHNWYDAGLRWSPNEAYVPGYIQDPQYDIPEYIRLELVRKSQYFEQNNGLAVRLGELFEQFTVGEFGIKTLSASSDEEWNRKADKWYRSWEPLCDLTSLHGMATNQKLVATRSFFDGEIFVLLTHGDVRPYFPRIQLIETHRVCSPSGTADLNGRRIIDGQEFDSRGRVIAYWIRDGFEQDAQPTRRAAENIIHIFKPRRPGQLRGIPRLAPVLGDLNGLDSLQKLEMIAAQDSADTVKVINNESGEAPADQFRQQKYGNTTQTSAGVDTTVQRTQFIKQAVGGRTVYLKPGETMQQFDTNRPTVATSGYWDFLAHKICAGVSISKLLALPYSIQGTVARADYDIANVFFRSYSSILAVAFTRIRNYAIEWAIQNVQELSDPPEDWRAVTSRPPRAVNVDVGRNSAADINELEAGLTNYDILYGEQGLDARTELRKKASDMKFIRDLAKEFDLLPGEIASLKNPAVNAALNAPAEPQQMAEAA